MNNDENSEKFIDVESLPIDERQQVAWQNCFQNNNCSQQIKRKGKGMRVLGKIAGILCITIVGGIFGSAITYSLIKSNNNVNTKQIVSTIPQSFSEDKSDTMSAADAFNKVAPAVVIVSTKSLANNGFTTGEVEGMGSGFII